MKQKKAQPWKESKEQRMERIAESIGSGKRCTAKSWGGKPKAKEARRKWKQQFKHIEC